MDHVVLMENAYLQLKVPQLVNATQDLLGLDVMFAIHVFQIQ